MKKLCFLLLLCAPPASITLGQNVIDTLIIPSVFSDSAVVKFKIADTAHISLEIFNHWGTKVATPINETLLPNQYTRVFHADTIVNGIYVYLFSAKATNHATSSKRGRIQKFTKITSIVDVSALSALTLFPNPVKDELSIENMPFNTGAIDITTLQGNPVKHICVNGQSEYRISLADLLAQPYILKIQNLSGKPNAKIFIKQ